MPLSHDDLDRRLQAAKAAAAAAADLLRAEFHRAGGPRGGGSHADVDDEAEALIVETLARHYPGEAYLGEELGSRVLGGGAPPEAGGPVWVVDPNDGTSPFLKGFRGSAVSIALIEDGLPALGVVHAWDGPAPAGDCFAWRLGGALTRNGRELRRTWPAAVGPGQVALVSHEADRKNSAANAACAAPLRYQALPSIAWRLALVAAGEGDVAVSLGGPVSWDLAGGHALLIGAGGVLLDKRGEPVRYDRDGRCEAGGGVFGGAPALARELAARDWGPVGLKAVPPNGLDLSFPVARAPRPPRDVLERAQGCLLGLLAGDALGGQVEFQSADQIRRLHPRGVCDLTDGGHWNTLAGQPTDDSEMALHLARTLVRDGRFDAAAVRESYRAWLATPPFDVGSTTRRGLRGIPDPESQANGALMRVSPLGIFGALRNGAEGDGDVASWAAEDAALTHPHPVCVQASALFAGTLAEVIQRGLSPREAFRHLLGRAEGPGVESALRRALAEAADRPPADYLTQAGWVLVALQNAVWQLLHAESLEAGLVDTVARGGDTDTNAAIAGALLGAVHGLGAVPARWRLAVLSCRPLAGLPSVHRPRPRACWPVDALVLAERLLAG